MLIVVYGGAKNDQNIEKVEGLYEKFKDGSPLYVNGLKPISIRSDPKIILIP